MTLALFPRPVPGRAPVPVRAPLPAPVAAPVPVPTTPAPVRSAARAVRVRRSPR